MSDSPPSGQKPEASPAELDENYDRLTRLIWSGIATPAIEWRREGDNAIAKFGDLDDAAVFVIGYLDQRLYMPAGADEETYAFWAIKRVETEETLRLKDRMSRKFLPFDSMVDQIKFPEPRAWGVPVEIKIPLAIFDTQGLKNLEEFSNRSNANRPKSARVEVEPASVGVVPTLTKTLARMLERTRHAAHTARNWLG